MSLVLPSHLICHQNWFLLKIEFSGRPFAAAGMQASWQTANGGDVDDFIVIHGRRRFCDFQDNEFMFLKTCPDCGTEIGMPHKNNCDVERCSICGDQRISCEGCKNHNPQLSAWTGKWPGWSPDEVNTKEKNP
jgi:hypothetical protein